MKQEKVEKFSIRKFKVGVGSALIGLSFLGATGALDNIPILNQLGIQSVYAAQGDTRTIEVTWLAEKSFAEIGKNQATTVDNGDGTFTTTFTPLPGKYAPSRVKLYQHDLPNAINVVAHDWLENLPDDGRHSNTNEPSDFSLGGITGNGNSAIINGAELEGKKLTPTFYFTNIRYADGSRGFTLARALGTKSSTSEKVLNATTRYEKDPSREKGQPNEVVVEAKNGKEVETTDYTFRRQDGSRVDSMHSASVPTGELNSVNPDDYITEDVRTKTEAPVNGVVRVAAKDKVETETIKSPVRYEKDPSREKGQPNIESKGQDGKSVTTTTYDVNSTNGEITENVGKPVVTPATETVVKVAAKDKVETENIPSPVRYEKDETREKDQPNLETKGQDGKSVTTTTYDVNSTNGEITENVGKPVVTPATETVIKVAAKDKVETENIPSPVRYEKDETREKDQPNIETKGQDGKSVTTTTYDVNSANGEVTENVGKPVVTHATETVIKVAAKDKVVEKELPSHVRYVGDENKENSTDPVRTEGKKGKEVTTTTYAVDPKTGTISESTKTERTEEPTDTVVTIGTKPKVELIKKDGRTIERTTRYRVIEATGGVVITTTDKLLSSNGEGALPPVVDVPEFNGGVNGDADGNASIHDVPEFNGGVNGDLDGNALINEAPEFNGGVNGDLDGNAAIHDAPEYTGPLAGNGLTGEGEMVEPPVVEVPEFDLNKLPKEVKEEPKQEVPNVGTGLNTFNDGRKKPAHATEIVPVASTKEEPKAETPKDVSTPVTLEQKNDEQGKQAPVQTASSKKEMKELPNTGTASNAALTLAGVTFAMFGTVMLAKKKD